MNNSALIRITRQSIRHLAGSAKGLLIHLPRDQKFVLKLPEGVAEVLYDQENGRLNLHHTEVPDIFRGKGVGNILAKEVLDYCVVKNIQVKITCSFLCNFVKKNPEYLRIAEISDDCE